MSKTLKFDKDSETIQVQEVRFRLGGRNYVMREATAEDAVIYRDALLNATELKDGKPVKVHNLAAVETLLIHRLTFDETDPANVFRVSMATVNGWPSRITKPLFQDAKKMSELGEELAEGNPTQNGEPSGIAVTSVSQENSGSALASA